MKEEQQQQQLEEEVDSSSTHVDEAKIYALVLGEKICYFKLSGVLPHKGTRASSSTIQLDAEIQQELESNSNKW